ncbi:MAG: hypothetical protein ABS36_18430 [Acidobacteria bacterium SCN 69-37]|nr:MAG: hypothetical protein ABS36_18430 [Acidobacteria bacterium SCN 69-37]
MYCRPSFRFRFVLPALMTLALLGSAATPSRADDRPDAARWLVLQQQSRAALASLGHPVRNAVDDEASAAPTRLLVVGFTGGREGPDSRVSGLVRLRHQIEATFVDDPNVVALTYNNRDWDQAADDIAARVALDENPLATAFPARPLIIVFGHSWGGGAITKFARRLGTHDIDVALAVYVDAFSLRNPRVPANVHYVVNLYQRAGIFRGFPLRGKSHLVLEDPSATTVLANLRIKPQTERYFGWHWNLVQPLLYRQHHRMGHDVRLHRYLLGLIESVETPADPLSAPNALTACVQVFEDDPPCPDLADSAYAIPALP